MAAGDAVRHGFLDEISLVITDRADKEEAIEVHSFKFQYHSDGRLSVRLSTSAGPSAQRRVSNPTTPATPKTISQQIESLVNNIHKMCKNKLSTLPNEFSANFRVKYTESAPRHFHISGFYESNHFYTLPETAREVRFGVVRMKNHKVNMTCNSIFVKDDDDIFAAPIESPKKQRHGECSVLSTVNRSPTAYNGRRSRTIQMDYTQENNTREEARERVMSDMSIESAQDQEEM